MVIMQQLGPLQESLDFVAWELPGQKGSGNGEPAGAMLGPPPHRLDSEASEFPGQNVNANSAPI